MIEGHHEDGCGHGVHEMDRRGYAGRHELIARQQKEGRAVREEGQIGECDQFAARGAKRLPLDYHQQGDDDRGAHEAVEQDGEIGQAGMARSGIGAQGQGERRDEAVADGGCEAHDEAHGARRGEGGKGVGSDAEFHGREGRGKRSKVRKDGKKVEPWCADHGFHLIN